MSLPIDTPEDEGARDGPPPQVPGFRDRDDSLPGVLISHAHLVIAVWRGMSDQRLASWVAEPFPSRDRQKLGKGKAPLANDNGCPDVEEFRKSLETACPRP